MSDPVVTKYYACAQFDTAGVCTQPVWVDQPSVFPPLTVSQGTEIGAAMFATLVTVSVIRRLLNQGATQQ